MKGLSVAVAEADEVQLDLGVQHDGVQGATVVTAGTWWLGDKAEHNGASEEQQRRGGSEWR